MVDQLIFYVFLFLSGQSQFLQDCFILLPLEFCLAFRLDYALYLSIAKTLIIALAPYLFVCVCDLIEWMMVMVMIMIMMARSDMNFLFLSLHGHSNQVMNSINDSRLDETILLSTYCGWLVHWILLQSRLCRKKKIL